jgi:hypothetical protein
MTKHYWGFVTITADRSLEAVVEELNVFLAPQVLVETDRFDEVPGYIASAEGLEFTLQGPPDDAEDDGYYCFYFLCEIVGLSSLPVSLSNLTAEAEPEADSQPRRRASAFLCARLRASTALTCTT